MTLIACVANSMSSAGEPASAPEAHRARVRSRPASSAAQRASGTSPSPSACLASQVARFLAWLLTVRAVSSASRRADRATTSDTGRSALARYQPSYEAKSSEKSRSAMSAR